MDNDALLAEIRKARAAYMREWRKKNPERVKKINQAYWAKKAKEMEKNKK